MGAAEATWDERESVGYSLARLEAAFQSGRSSLASHQPSGSSRSPAESALLRACEEMGIQASGENHYRLDREPFLEALAATRDGRTCDTVPEQIEGRTIGVRLFGVRPSSIKSCLGLKNGDRLEGLNQYSFGSPREAMEAYRALRTESTWVLRLNRRGKSMGILYEFL